MAGEISLEKQGEKAPQEEEKGLLGHLEEKVNFLLGKYQALKRERDDLANALDEEREKSRRLERNMDALTKDRDKVKSKIDQLLHRLKNVDL